MTTPRRSSDFEGVKSVERAVKILTALGETPFPMSVGELALKLSIPAPGVHRMLRTLAVLGWVEQNSKTLRYRLGTRMLGVGAAGLITNPVVQNSKAFMQRLSQETGYDSYLSTLVKSRVVYLARTTGVRGSDADFAEGVSMPAHAFADGKLLLAYTSLEERQTLYAGGLHRYTKLTITDPDELETELDTIRRNGFALDRGERFVSGTAIAVPVMGVSGEPLLALMCAGKVDISAAQVPLLKETLTAVAQDLSAQLVDLGDMPRYTVEFAKYNFE